MKFILRRIIGAVAGLEKGRCRSRFHMVARAYQASAEVVAPHYSHIPATFLHAGICEDARPNKAAALFVLTEEIRDDTARRLRWAVGRPGSVGSSRG